ncbi:MAG: protein kinase [Pseudomonadota bacterium]
MAKKLKVGDVIHGYRITKVFGPGMMAISYGALNSAGEKVFFKQYKSPAPTVVWYDAFRAYQHELSTRVSSGPAAHFAVRQLDAFEEVWGGPCYFQAYEFVEKGGDLQQLLDAERELHRTTGRAPARDPAIWARHVTWAKVFISAVAALHDSRVVHADLKPANAYLIADPTIGAGYQLKLIDMDFSLLADKRAPWHGFQGYVGTDNYRSPEHMTRGGRPTLASDVFTCGLMLYELLAGEHPYWRDDQGEYAKLAMAHAAKPPALTGVMPAPADNAEVSAALHRCLSPDPEKRPTAAQLRAVLSGRGAKPAAHIAMPTAPAITPVAARPQPAAVAPDPGKAPPILADQVELQGPDGRSIRIGVRTELGKTLVRQFGPDGEFWDARQCVLERSAAREWFVTPLPGTTNETLLNGQALSSPRVLRHGDQIAVGRQAKGIAKLPLKVVGR